MEPYNPYELRKFTIPEIHFGSGAIEIVDRIVMKLGAKKIMIVTDPGTEKAGWAEIAARFIRGTGIPYTVFNNVTSNPKDCEVREGFEIYNSENCDLITAVGGGSPIDCAKGISIMISSGRDITDPEISSDIKHGGPPLICIPTTAGTAADISHFTLINNTAMKKKIIISGEQSLTEISLIDSITTTTMNPELTAETGMSALATAFEAYVSGNSSPVTDVYAIKAVSLLSHNIIPAMEHHRDLRYRDKMMLGSLLAGIACSNTSPGVIQSMTNALCGYLDLHNGKCSALLIENSVKYSFYSSPERYTDLARAMGIDTDGMGLHRIKDALLDEISLIRQKAGLKYSLGKLGITSDMIPQLARNAAEDLCLIKNPRNPGTTEIEQIYSASL